MRLTTNHSYNQIQDEITPHWFSIRISPDPLHLFKYGLIVSKFTSKLALVDYLNLQLEIIRSRDSE